MSLPFSPAISDALATLNRLNIVLDERSCFIEEGHRVCLTTDRGVLISTVNGTPIPWREIVPVLKARAPVPMKHSPAWKGDFLHGTGRVRP